MKTLFVSVFGILVLLSVVVWATQPREISSGKVPLVWVSDDNPARRAQLDLFNKTFTKDQAVLDPDNTGMEKIIVQSLAGTGPDLFDSYSHANLEAYVKSGVAWDVTDELKKRNIDVDSDLWSVEKPIVTLNGRAYGFGTNSNTDALWFNKSLFDKAGAPYPKGSWTWQQFLPLAEKLTIKDSNGRIQQYGMLFDWRDWAIFVHQWGGRVFVPGGSKCILDSPQSIAGLQLMHDMVYKYHVMPSPADADSMATQGGWSSGMITLFGAGKGAMALGGRWWLVTLRQYNGLRLGAVECPTGRYRVFPGGGRATIINRNSPRREQALDFLKYLDSPEYSALVNHQADAVAAVPKSCYTELFLHDPEYPNDDYSQVWRDVMPYGIVDESSPYIDEQECDDITNKQIQLIQSDQKPVAQAMHDAASQINAIIARNIADDPILRARYDKEASLRQGPFAPYLPDAPQLPDRGTAH